jgi:peptide/nickel transport system substrate-binding protein
MKRILAVFLMVFLAFSAFCGGQGDKQTAAPSAMETGKYKESPILSELVKAGKLDPIQKRLPDDPFVVGPGVLMPEKWVDWTPGKYGGTLQDYATFDMGHLNINNGASFLRAPSQGTQGAKPSLLEAYRHNDDYTVFTMTIRKGLKWSDGKPVTTEDVRFTFEDMYLNPESGKTWPQQLYTQGNALYGTAKLKVIDTYTFELSFGKPYGNFEAVLCSWIPSYEIILKPSHYLKQFHKDFADPAKLAALVKENGVPDWSRLLLKKDVSHWAGGVQDALGLPVLRPWYLKELKDRNRIFERNPYYHVVDTENKQLPYVDYFIVTIVNDADAVTSKIMAGDMHIASGGETTLGNMALYKQNAEKNNYRVFLTGSFNNPMTLFVNNDYEYGVANSGWQKLVSDPDKNFAKALAYAIDAEEINKQVYFGMFGKPFFNNTEYDPDTASKLLDAAGMTKRDRDNFRTDPYGNSFTAYISYYVRTPDFNPCGELIKEQFEAVGIRTKLDVVKDQLFFEKRANNKIMLSLMWNDGTAWRGGISEDFLPISKGPWSPLTWRYLVTDGKEGRKPDSNMQKFYDLYSEWKSYPPASSTGMKVFDELETWLKDNYVFIPIVGSRIKPNIVKKNLKNVQKDGAPYELDTYITFEQVYFDN